MKKLITKIILPALGIALWLAICFPISKKPGGFNAFKFWILAGFPFGMKYMCLKRSPKGYGLTGTVGIFALNMVIGCLIGGVMLVGFIVKIFVNLVRIIIGRLDLHISKV